MHIFLRRKPNWSLNLQNYLKFKNPPRPNTGRRRPIIIASHSQGTTHAARLLKEFFDGKDLQYDLVAAYLVGMPVPKDYFKNIKVCETPTEIGYQDLLFTLSKLKELNRNDINQRFKSKIVITCLKI